MEEPMRTSAKKRLHFFIIAIVVFTLGFQLLPESLPLNEGLIATWPLALAVGGYFVLLPVLYWLWVIKSGKQKPWKILIVFSLACLCARYSFPSNIAEYFEFITYVRYPIIAILLIVELYLMVTIIKGLWQARSLSGDPRVHTFDKYKNDDKKLTAALPLSWEPASWYYTFPRFSRNHPEALTALKLMSSNRWHWLSMIAVFFIAGVISYQALVGWSEIAAVIVASLFFYSIILITANHRVSKHYSIYQNEEKLMINGAFLNFLSVNTSDIAAVNIGQFNKKDNKEQLMMGKGDKANIELVFTQPQIYVAMMGSLNEPVDKVWLNVANPQNIADALDKTDSQ
ncbi:hypothetical protein HII17_09155 [Thalassotalea sp. M1531]|uniref:Uncharacterized protein n=2 Tax=Thalassotalea algicola TaxID=2716224 RepID=A0A7Y0Q682_9GAMM|nr:hypothetical protein [Thalassotalea algicola]